VTETIFAVASGAPPAALAIVRISGARALDAAASLAGTLPPPRRAALRALRDPQTSELLDRALVLSFPAPASATGEDVVELHLHGGRAVIAAVTAALAALPGLRPAEAGEFTRRALLNGRIDLTEAEGLADLLSAETEMQRRAAVRMSEGAVSRAVNAWGDRLLALSAAVEAALDFSDEGDVAAAPAVAVQAGARQLADEISALLAVPPAERLRDGVRVVLAGPPNSGKSSLLNAMIGRDAAIVSPIAGTTRDAIEAPVVHGGIAYLLTDTAGLVGTSADPIELIGVDRARQAIDAADLVLWLGDKPPPRADALWLWPRADARGEAPAERLAVSAKTGGGLAGLWRAIADRVATLLPMPDQIALNQRQRMLLAECRSALAATVVETDELIIAEQLRVARDLLHRITGRLEVEAVLDTLFARFCIGK